jgi:TatD DNase family protein
MSPSELDLVDSHCHLDFPDFDPGNRRDHRPRPRRRGQPHGHHLHPPEERTPRPRHRRGQPRGLLRRRHPPDERRRRTAGHRRRTGGPGRHPKFVGIGETGLDYHYTADSAAIQQTSLRIHIEAAQETGLPLIIHSRDADADMERSWPKAWPASPMACVMHCFSSGPRLAEAALEMGFYLSMSGIAAFPKSTRTCATSSPPRPLDRILETDSPYLAPRPIAASATNRPMSPIPPARGAEAVRPEPGGRVRRPDHGEFRPAVPPRHPAGEGRMMAGSLHHPRLRLVGRRAAPRRRSGATAIPRTRRTAAAAARFWSTARRPTA